ncbi:uncharacterized protein TRIADDRAFT_31864 [Trichoplax adhaerens]|uniref:Aspartyl/asparaginy/proline hydroxylase domain-containing protein n=1 Tax=Trichoplax adhaerens TaxID=10228 RepID=B3SA42_TRIAD|nr:hypothetical protein TRIADDRAFT_31864 [Trichoplax adhaerens]EDV20367.1 hypothetical protein TRIADDRAFT_31864 [Trichoplax adhaerens]|eukprot:XP_002117061.1 hypothetical protein TRIADDRAFT_31864 [Trichoplax adhaerens]
MDDNDIIADKIKRTTILKQEPGKVMPKKNGNNNLVSKDSMDDLTLAETFLKQKNYNKSLDAFDPILKRDPTNVLARYGKAKALDKLAEQERSNQLLHKAIENYHKVGEQRHCSVELRKAAYLRLADRASFLGSHKKAMEVLEKLVKESPTDVNILNKLGIQYLLIKQNSQAESTYRKVLEISPDDGFAQVHLGFLLNTKSQYHEAIPLLSAGINSQQPGTDAAKFYLYLGDALTRVGRKSEANSVYNNGVIKGYFLSEWQRSLYNVDRLRGKPWWNAEETGYLSSVRLLEKHWKSILKEGLNILNQETAGFQRETENLRCRGDWKQFQLYVRGQRNDDNCKRAPLTCSIINQIPEAKSNKRGQVQYSVMFPGTHIWPHTGPTNCRLRLHLGLKVPSAVSIRVGNETRFWEEGKVMILDDSFEHEVWHNGDSLRLVFIVDVWHPDLTTSERAELFPV